MKIKKPDGQIEPYIFNKKLSNSKIISICDSSKLIFGVVRLDSNVVADTHSVEGEA